MVDSDRLVVDYANVDFVLGEKARSMKWSTLVDSFWSPFCWNCTAITAVDSPHPVKENKILLRPVMRGPVYVALSTLYRGPVA